MCKISVIIPVYNVEGYIKECLDSVTNQTLEDIEIICVDDGSNDLSATIIEKYTCTDCRVKLIKKKNEGAGIARNIGIKSSTGEYICFMDADDIYPNFTVLEKMYKAAKTQNVMICGGAMSYLENSNITNSNETGYSFEEAGIMEYYDYQYDYGFTRFIYNRQWIIENNIFFPNISYHEDPPFFVNAMILAKKFYVLNEPTYTYRISHKKPVWTETKFCDFLAGIKLLLELSKNNDLNKLTKRIVQRLNDIYFIDALSSINISEAIKKKLSEIINNLSIEEKENINYLFNIINRTYKVSIIIPVYNVEKYLSKCLESVMKQTYENIEIICVNDGSCDNSLNILNNFKNTDSRIKIINKKNGGLSSARNVGINDAIGTFCYFVDSDDWIENNTIELLLTKMLEYNTDCVVHGVKNIPEDEKSGNMANSTQEWFESFYKKDGLYDIPINIKKEVPSVAWNKLYKTNIIKEFNCRFPEGLINEDEAFLWVYMIHCKNYYFLNKNLYYYLRRTNSIMSTRDNSLKVLDILKILEYIYISVKANADIKIYSETLTELYIEEVGYLFERMPNKYRKEAIKLIKYYSKNVNRHKKIKKLYYHKKYEFFYNLINFIFSIKNNYKHKIITILGIQFKLKSKKLLLRYNLSENSFVEDIFSIKNKGIRKVITIFGLKFKLKSKKLVEKKKWQDLQNSIDYINQQLQEQAQRYSESLVKLNNKLNEQTQKYNNAVADLNNNIEQQTQRINDIKQVVDFNRDEIKNNFDITCELLISSLSQGENNNGQ